MALYIPAPPAPYVFPGISSLIEAANYAEKKNYTNFGGTATEDTPYTRVLTLEDGSITGASLSAGRVVLPAGYYWCSFYSVAYQTETNRAALRNNGTGAAIIMGSTNKADGTGDDQAPSVGAGFFNLSAGATVELMHDQNRTQNSSGKGIGSNSNGWTTDSEYFARLSLIRFGDTK